MSESAHFEEAREHLGPVCEALNVPDGTETTAAMVARQAADELQISSRGADNVVAASLLIGCKRSHLPITVHDVVDEWTAVDAGYEVQESFARKHVLRTQNAITSELDIEVPPTEPTELIQRYAEELGMPPELPVVAVRLLKDVLHESPAVVAGGQSPKAVAASALYLAARLNDRRLDYTQDVLADVAGTNPVTIRHRYADIRDALGDEADLKRRPRYRSGSIEADERLAAAPRDAAGGAPPRDVAETGPDGEGEPASDAGADVAAGSDGRGDETSDDATADGSTETATGADDSTVTLSASVLALARRHVSDPETGPDDLSEFADAATRTLVKEVVDGQTLAPPAREEATEALDWPLDEQLRRLIDVAIAESAVGSVDEFVEAACRRELGVPSGTESLSVELPSALVALLDAERGDRSRSAVVADALGERLR